MPRRTMLGFVCLLSVAGCATTATNQPNAAQQVRQRPRRRNVQRVLGEAVRRAAGCLPRAAGTVTVSGEFHGDSGGFRVLNIEAAAPLGTSVRTCVREEFETAHVETFADERYAAARGFGPDGVILAAENGNGPAQPVAAGGENDTGAVSSPPPASSAPATVIASASPPPSSVSPPDTGTVAEPGSPAPVASVAPPPVEPTENTHRTTVAATEAGPIPSTLAAGCYQSVMRVNSTLGGRIRLRFEVTTDGAARNVTTNVIGTPTGPAPLFANAMRCIEQRTRTFAFAHSDSGSIDLVVSLTPGRNGGAVSIERRTAGLTATAPGREAGEAPATPTTTSAAPANWNDISAAGAAGAPSFNQQIAESVRGRVGDIRTCYQTQLTHSPELLLRTRVRFGIDAAGQVPTASSTTVVLAGDAEAATAVAQCVEGIVRSTGFPARAGASTLETSLPFSFSPGIGANAATTSAVRNAPAATGRIDPVRTAATIRANTDQVRACYTYALRMHPDLSGRVLVRFTVDAAGRVIAPSSQVTPVSGDRDAFESVASCIEGVLQSIPLPPPTGGPAAVALPFDFSPNAL